MSDEKGRLFERIYTLYGNVRRARGCFLYTEKGVRLTDMYQEDGRAILGWGGNPFTVFKNVLSRGITGSFKTSFNARLSKAVTDLLDCADNAACACEAADKSKNDTRSVLVYSQRPAAADIEQEFVPWNSVPGIKYSEKNAVLVVPPFSWTDDIYIVAVKPGFEDKIRSQIHLEEKALSAPVAAAVCRSIYNLIQQMKLRSEKDWFTCDKILNRYFERKGPYLYPKLPPEKYQAFVDHMLDCSVVINPVYGRPSIVPYGAEPGVFSKLRKNQFEF